MYFYVTWYSDTDTAMWFRNNVGRNCADPARADYAQYCGELIRLCKDLRNLTAGVNATAAAGIDKVLSAEAGIPVAAMCESFTGELRPVFVLGISGLLSIPVHLSGVDAVWHRLCRSHACSGLWPYQNRLRPPVQQLIRNARLVSSAWAHYTVQHRPRWCRSAICCLHATHITDSC